MFKIFLFGFVASIITISFGHLLHLILFNKKNDYKISLSECGILGFIAIGFVSLFFNFFIKISPIITNLSFVMPFISLYLIRYKITKISTLKFFNFNIYVAIIVLLFLAYSNVYRPDSGWYHLPYVKIINEFKIIIGITSLHSMFGAISVMQYISAFYNNFIFEDIGITLPLALMPSYFILFFFQKFNLKEPSALKKIFLFSVISYFFLEMNRYSDYGNDNPAHLYFFYLVFLILDKNKKYNFNIFFKKISLISIFCFLNKPFLIFSLLFPIYFYLKHKIFKSLSSYPLFAIFFLSLWLIKNTLVSGCALYPINVTCFNSLSWYSSEAKFQISARNVSQLSELHAKGWGDILKGNYINYQNKFDEKKIFLSNFNWLDASWIKYSSHSIVKKINIFLLYLSVVFLVLKISSRTIKTNIFITAKRQLKNENYKIIFIISLIGMVIFLTKFPVGRYGVSYLVLFITCIFIPLYFSFFSNFYNKRISKILYSFLILLSIIFVSKNLLRITNNFDKEYHLSPWPKIYDNRNDSNGIPLKFNKIEKNDILTIYYGDSKSMWFADEKLCMYNKGPCSPNNKALNQFSVKLINGYYILKLNKH